MPTLHGIHVRIVIDGEVAKEYENPNAVPVPCQVSTCVRAEPGQSFIVEVGVMEGYDLRDAPYLLVQMLCDGFGKPSRRKCNVLRIPHQGQTVTRRGIIAAFEHYRGRDEETGDWYKYRYAFGALEISKLSLKHSTNYQSP